MPKADRGPSRPLHLRCPRCGYDLSGAPAALDHPNTPASDACTICPECGLKSLWADIRDPSRNKIRWLFEHTPRRRLGLGRAWRTLFRTVLPWRFWRTVTLSATVSVPRLLVWLGVLIVPVHVLWGTVRLARHLLEVMRWAGSLNRLTPADWRFYIIDAVGYPVVAPRWVGGAWVWGTPEPNASFLLPLGPTLLAPLILLLLSRSRATAKVRTGHILRAGIYGAGWIAGWYTFFAVLTLEKVVRGWVQGTPAPLGISPWVAGAGRSSAALWLVSLCLIWFALWWWFAIIRCMKLPRGRLVWALVVVASLLLGVNLALMDREFSYAAVRMFWGVGL